MEILVKKNPIMKEVYEEYNKFVKSNDLYNGYSNYERDYFNVLMLNEERIKGMEEGMQKGIEQEKYSLARNMKNKNMDLNLISELTGLSIEKIEKL
ncbi:hypothetical protein A9X77_11920 [Brachyspira hyodysenteriae]|nr:hypothetical protein A9X77_11920 [Brachyspira hyodysenteriae]TVL86931.1 hypothetical protein A9X78_11850 [Brachyspira hyodysenteriae]